MSINKEVYTHGYEKAVYQKGIADGFNICITMVEQYAKDSITKNPNINKDASIALYTAAAQLRNELNRMWQ